MDEDISIIDSNTRNEKIKNFLTNNKKKIISSVLILVILVISIYSIDTYKKQAKLKLADKYNFAVINFKPENSQKIIEDLKSKGTVVYFIPGGGSNSIGALGYVECLKEIIKESGIPVRI